MVSNICASLCCLLALALTCESQLDGNFWWLNQDLRAVALGNANADAGLYEDVGDSVTERDDSGIVSFIDDFGRVQINKDPIRKDRLIKLIETTGSDTQTMKSRQNNIINDEKELPYNPKIPRNTSKVDSARTERKMSGGGVFNNINFGQSRDGAECSKGDCNNGYSTPEKGSVTAEKDDCECKTYYECFSGNGTPSSSSIGRSKCANRVPYMICCTIPNTNIPEPPLQPKPTQLRSLTPDIVFSEDPSIYSSGYNFHLNQRPKRSPMTSDITSDPYWNIKNQDTDSQSTVPKSPLSKIVSETNGYGPGSPTELCTDSGARRVVKPGESTSGIQKLPQNWNIKVVSGVVDGNKPASGGGYGRDMDESPSFPKELQRRHFSVFQEFNPGFEAPATTQKSTTTTRERKPLTNADEDSDYYFPAPESPAPKKKFGVPTFGYGIAETEQYQDGEDEGGAYDSVFVDSASEGDLVYPGCGEVYVSTEDAASLRLTGKYSLTHQALSVSLSDEEHAPRCTAALLHPRVAIVPAHCISSSSHVNLRIRSTAGMQERLVHAVQHPRFNPATQRNDVALLIWRTPLMLSPRLQPVCLPSPGTAFASSFCTTSRSDGAGKSASVLSKQECEEQLLNSAPRSRQYPTNHFLCSVLAPMKSTCAVPDEESPLICVRGNRWHLAGTPIGLEHSPSLYTDISQFTSWIQQVLEDRYII